MGEPVPLALLPNGRMPLALARSIDREQGGVSAVAQIQTARVRADQARVAQVQTVPQHAAFAQAAERDDVSREIDVHRGTAWVESTGVAPRLTMRLGRAWSALIAWLRTPV
jgi:hypothetical protein